LILEKANRLLGGMPSPLYHFLLIPTTASDLIQLALYASPTSDFPDLSKKVIHATAQVTDVLISVS
jgi:hypothetical protein